MTNESGDDLIARLEAGEGSRELQNRILSNVEFDTNGGCWLWSGSASGDRPRGFMTAGGRSKLAHRISFAAFTGTDPSGGMVCHKCDNPMCVNPGHLYLGDHASNVRDMVQRRRYFAATMPEKCREAGRRGGAANTWTAGAGNPRVKLSPEQVEAIRADPRSTAPVAREYGLHKTTVQRIRKGLLWK